MMRSEPTFCSVFGGSFNRLTGLFGATALQTGLKRLNPTDEEFEVIDHDIHVGRDAYDKEHRPVLTVGGGEDLAASP